MIDILAPARPRLRRLPDAAQSGDAVHRHRHRPADRRAARLDTGDGRRAGAAVHLQDGRHRLDRAAHGDVRVRHLWRRLHRDPVPHSRRADRRARCCGTATPWAARASRPRRSAGRWSPRSAAAFCRRSSWWRSPQPLAKFALRFSSPEYFVIVHVRPAQRGGARQGLARQCLHQHERRHSDFDGRHRPDLWRLPLHLRLAAFLPTASNSWWSWSAPMASAKCSRGWRPALPPSRSTRSRMRAPSCRRSRSSTTSRACSCAPRWSAISSG